MSSIPAPTQLTLFPQDKRCTRCKQMRALHLFGRLKAARDGLQSWCKPCDAENKRISRTTHPEKERAAKQRYYATHRDAALAHARTYQAIHKEGIQARKRADRVANPGKYREQDRRKRELHGEACKARDKAYYVAHREERLRITQDWHRRNLERVRETRARYYATNRDRMRADQRGYRMRNKESLRERLRRYRMRRMGNGGNHSAAQWLALCAQYDYRCLACGATNVPLTEDHIVPVVHGGSDDIGNIQPLCKPCNSKKRTKHTDYRP